MAMMRRNFIEAGIGGVALSVAQGVARAQSPGRRNPGGQGDTVADLVPS